jgi:hypothetical protein
MEDKIDIILDDSIGTFFPYYAKKSKPQLFDSMMREQNFAMNSTSAIPLFGYTINAQEFEVEHNGMEQQVASIIWEHPHILAIESTASSNTLGKFMVLVDREMKDDVEEFLDSVFEKMPDLEGQPENFRKPQRGGNAFKKDRMHNISNYLQKLEDQMKHDTLMGGDDDSEYSTTPPVRTRRPTISYAQATKRLSFQQETILTDSQQKTPTHSTQTMTTTMSTLTQSSLNDAINNLRQETERSINSLREELKTEVKSMENNIAIAVITAMQKANRNDMEEAKSETASDTSIDTAATTKSMMDRIDSLTQMVQLLAEKVHEVVENQDATAQKRARSLETTSRQILNSPNRPTEKDATHSPPAKLPRPSARSKSPKTLPPPPNGVPNTAGTQEGS